jgi:hypothetical protein
MENSKRREGGKIAGILKQFYSKKKRKPGEMGISKFGFGGKMIN